jgi:hypothetical protein
MKKSFNIWLFIDVYLTTLSAQNMQRPVVECLNSINQLIFVMVKYGVLFEVRTEFLNNI